VRRSIFLDHAAGSPLRAEVAAAMLEACVGLAPNPSGAHRMARAARGRLEDARERVAALCGVEPRAVVFTSGGTESCNLALRAQGEPRYVSAIEHAAVREAAVGAAVLSVDGRGVLDVEAAADAIRPGSLVSVMAANNETGAIQPLAELVEALGARREQVVLHSDAVGAAWCLELAELARSCDLVSLAAHKVAGPAGSGALVISERVTVAPLLSGGGQERGLRPGTQDVAGAVGLATALELAAADRASGAVAEMAVRRDALEQALAGVEGLEVSSAGADRLSSHCHVTIEGLRSEELLVLLDQAGLCAAAGAACASGAPRPSRVLLAMGVSTERARGALRLSLAPTTTDDEVASALEIVLDAVKRLRR
jgi:cysteine desulfurase